MVAGPHVLADRRGTATVFSLTAQKEYSADAGLLFRDPGFDQKLFGTTFLAPNRDPAREAATNVKLVSLDIVAAAHGALRSRG